MWRKTCASSAWPSLHAHPAPWERLESRIRGRWSLVSDVTFSRATEEAEIAGRRNLGACAISITFQGARFGRLARGGPTAEAEKQDMSGSAQRVSLDSGRPGPWDRARRKAYREAVSGLAIARRPDRHILRIYGKAPFEMLRGVVTHALPSLPEDGEGDARKEGATYGLVLTPKGKIVADVKSAWMGRSAEDGLALDAPVNAKARLLEHFKRYLPPRLARVELRGESLCTLLGPAAGDIVRETGGPGPACAWGISEGGPMEGGRLFLRGAGQPDSWDVWSSPRRTEELVSLLTGRGAPEVPWDVWETLRVEAGHPAYGVDMDEGTLPAEAGLADQAIDHEKGCYTGQEVVVRIRDRGRVNWRLRALRFGAWRPRPGDHLFGAEKNAKKKLGRVTSVVWSPSESAWIGLGYLRREASPPATLRLASDASALVFAARMPVSGATEEAEARREGAKS